ARAALGVSGDERLVLFAGRPTPEKGIEVLAQALTRLPGVRGVVAGPAGAPAPLDSLGVLDPEALAAWMAAADVLCLPSFAEGTPVAVSEALACGTPVVASAVG